MKRLFFALWPDQQSRQYCSAIMSTISHCGGRPVQFDNLHVTLVFLGNVDDSIETSIIQAAEQIPMQKIVISFDELSYWRKPGVLCLTAKEHPPEFTDLAMRLSALATHLGIVVDERSFTPHITIFRKSRCEIQANFEPVVWESDSFVLVESCSVPGGVEYRVVRNFKNNIAVNTGKCE